MQEQLEEQRQCFELKLQRLRGEKEEIEKEAASINTVEVQRELEAGHRQNEGMKQKVECLGTEIEGLHRTLSALRRENERMKCGEIEIERRYKGQLAVKETECNGLRTKYDDLCRDLEESKSNEMEKERVLQSLQHQHREMKAQIEGKKEEIRSLSESVLKKEKALKERLNAARDALKSEMSKMEEAVSANNVERESLKLELQTVESQHVATLQALKQEHFESLNHVVEAKQESERKYQELKSQFQELEASSVRERDRLNKELQSTSSRVEQLEEVNDCIGSLLCFSENECS